MKFWAKLGVLLLLPGACLVGACATTPSTVMIDGQAVPRTTSEYVGQPYSVRHKEAHPRPGGPSGGVRAAGGSIFGQVCGVDVSWEVEHRGDHVQLTGQLDTDQQAQIRVADESGQRSFTGSLGSHAVDLRLRSNQIIGRVGPRYVDLKQDGEAFSGPMEVTGTEEKTSAKVNGRTALWAMPAADQAAVLPILLTCFVANIGQFGRSAMEIGFGGPMGMVARGTSAIQNQH